MAIGDERVICWPFEYSGTIRFADDAVGTTTKDESWSSPSVGFMIVDDATSMPSGITNVIVEFETMLESAYNSINGSGASFRVSLLSTGKIQIENSSANSLWVLGNSGSTTADLSTLGLVTGAAIEIPGLSGSGEHTGTYQAAGQWFPTRPHEDDTGERVRHVLVTSPPTLTGVQSVVCHSDLANPASYRLVSWDDLHHARMFQSAVEDATASTIAGVTQSDPNVAFENLVRYWADNTTPSPQTVYVRNTNTATSMDGPYQLAMPNAAVSDGGVARAWQRSDLRQRRFRCQLELVKE